MVGKKGMGITPRFLILILAVSLIPLSLVGILGIYSIDTTGDDAVENSKKALKDEAEINLQQLVQDRANEGDKFLEGIEKQCLILRDYINALYQNDSLIEGDTGGQEYLELNENNMYGILEDKNIGDIFVPNTSSLTSEVNKTLNITAQLRHVFLPIVNNDDAIVAGYIGTETNVNRYFPYINITHYIPGDFDMTGRPWYVAAKPTNNPSNETAWTEIYVDATGKGLMVTVAAPFFNSSGHFVGVIGLDVLIGSLIDNVLQIQVEETGYGFLVDSNKKMVAAPGLTTDPAWETEVEGYNLNDTNSTSFANVLNNMASGDTGVEIINVEETEGFDIGPTNSTGKKYIAYAPVETTGWSLAVVVPEKEVIAEAQKTEDEINDTKNSMLIYSIILILAAVGGISVLGFVFVNNITKPVKDLTDAAIKVRDGNLDAEVLVKGNDEIAELSEAINEMIKSIKLLTPKE